MGERERSGAVCVLWRDAGLEMQWRRATGLYRLLKPWGWMPGPRLPPRTASGSLALPQLGSELMSAAPVTTKGHSAIHGPGCRLRSRRWLSQHCA